MPTVPAVRVVRAAAVTRLREATLPGGASARIGNGKVPATKTTPYAVVYGSGIADSDGPASDVQADTDQLLQVTCVGDDPDEAEGLADGVLAVLLARATWAGIPGRSLMGQPLLEVYRPTGRDDDVTPSLFHTVVMVRIPLTTG